MCVMMTEIQIIDGGQKDALLSRANIKNFKKVINLFGEHLGYPKQWLGATVMT